MIKGFSDEDNNKSGIYKITHIPSNRFYIGSTNNFYNRICNHRQAFLENKNSQYMQNVYNKTKNLDEFKMDIIEIVDLEYLRETEQRYLNIFFDKQKTCFNLEAVVHRSSSAVVSEYMSEKRSNAAKKKWLDKDYKQKVINSLTRKPYKLIDPNNILHEGIGIHEFCRKNNLSVRHIDSLLKKKIKSHKGWRLPEYIDYKYDMKELIDSLAKKNRKTYNVILQSPTGELIGPITNLCNFLKENGLFRASVNQLIKKEIKQTKGWTLYKNLDEEDTK